MQNIDNGSVRIIRKQDSTILKFYEQPWLCSMNNFHSQKYDKYLLCDAAKGGIGSITSKTLVWHYDVKSAKGVILRI